MTEREEVVALCLKFKNAYIDHPFSLRGQPGSVDYNWTVARIKQGRATGKCNGRQKNPDKIFAWIFSREYLGEMRIWVNVKADSERLYACREIFKNVIPAYHMNKEHWNSVILNGSMSGEELEKIIKISYEAVLGNGKMKRT